MNTFWVAVLYRGSGWKARIHRPFTKTKLNRMRLNGYKKKYVRVLISNYWIRLAHVYLLYAPENIFFLLDLKFEFRNGWMNFARTPNWKNIFWRFILTFNSRKTEKWIDVNCLLEGNIRSSPLLTHTSSAAQ